jgi:hypothetical protein
MNKGIESVILFVIFLGFIAYSPQIIKTLSGE